MLSGNAEKPSSQAQLKVRDEQGKIGHLLSVDPTRSNPFLVSSLDGASSWYCKGVTAIKTNNLSQPLFMSVSKQN